MKPWQIFTFVFDAPTLQGTMVLVAPDEESARAEVVKSASNLASNFDVYLVERLTEVDVPVSGGTRKVKVVARMWRQK